METRKIKFIQFFTVFILSFLLYFNTLNNKFALDDTLVLTENKYTKGGTEGIVKILKTDAFEGFYGESKNLLPGGRYRPLSQIVLNIEYQFFKLKAKPYHFVNILLFSLVMMLLLNTLNLMLNTIFPTIKLFSVAFITTLITLVHPIHTEVVANIKSIDLILAFAFALLIIHETLKFCDDSKKFRLVLIFIYFFLGILSKENIVTFIAVIPLIVLYFRKINLKSVLVSVIPLFAGLMAYLILRFSFLPTPKPVVITELLNDPFLGVSEIQRIATVIYTWFVYFKLMIFPLNLTHDYYPYVIEIMSFSNPIVLLSTIFIIAIVGYASFDFIKKLKSNTKPSIYSFGVLFFFAVFSASSNLFVNIGAFMNERFVFIADVGLFLLFAYFLFEHLPKRFPKYSVNISKSIFLLIFVLFALKTYSRNKVWYDDFTLFTTDVKVSKNSAKCNVSAGGKVYEKSILITDSLLKLEYLKQAESFLLKGISIHPNYFQAYWLLGNIYFEMNEIQESFETYKYGLSISTHKDVMMNLYNLALKAKTIHQFQESRDILNFLKTKTHKPEYDYQIADSYLNEKKVDSALIVLHQAIKIDSLYDEDFNKLGEIYGRYLENYSLSKYYLLKAYEINPNNTSVLENLGVLNGFLHLYKESLLFFKKALELKPDDNQLLRNIAISYQKMGDNKNAEIYFKKAGDISK